jgi:hypothetical protein
MEEFDWDWNVNDLEEMGNREAWEDAQAEMQEAHPANDGYSDEELEELEEIVEDGDWAADEWEGEDLYGRDLD